MRGSHCNTIVPSTAAAAPTTAVPAAGASVMPSGRGGMLRVPTTTRGEPPPLLTRQEGTLQAGADGAVISLASFTDPGVQPATPFPWSPWGEQSFRAARPRTKPLLAPPNPHEGARVRAPPTYRPGARPQHPDVITRSLVAIARQPSAWNRGQPTLTRTPGAAHSIGNEHGPPELERGHGGAQRTLLRGCVHQCALGARRLFET